LLFLKLENCLHFCFGDRDPHGQDAHCQYLNQFLAAKAMLSTKIPILFSLPIEFEQQFSVHDFRVRETIKRRETEGPLPTGIVYSQ
jgi:hypothetical protein